MDIDIVDMDDFDLNFDEFDSDLNVPEMLVHDLELSGDMFANKFMTAGVPCPELAVGIPPGGPHMTSKRSMSPTDKQQNHGQNDDHALRLLEKIDESSDSCSHLSSLLCADEVEPEQRATAKSAVATFIAWAEGELSCPSSDSDSRTSIAQLSSEKNRQQSVGTAETFVDGFCHCSSQQLHCPIPSHSSLLLDHHSPYTKRQQSPFTAETSVEEFCYCGSQQDFPSPPLSSSAPDTPSFRTRQGSWLDFENSDSDSDSDLEWDEVEIETGEAPLFPCQAIQRLKRITGPPARRQTRPWSSSAYDDAIMDSSRENSARLPHPENTRNNTNSVGNDANMSRPHTSAGENGSRAPVFLKPRLVDIKPRSPTPSSSTAPEKNYSPRGHAKSDISGSSSPASSAHADAKIPTMLADNKPSVTSNPASGAPTERAEKRVFGIRRHPGVSPMHRFPNLHNVGLGDPSSSEEEPSPKGKPSLTQKQPRHDFESHKSTQTDRDIDKDVLGLAITSDHVVTRPPALASSQSKETGDDHANPNMSKPTSFPRQVTLPQMATTEPSKTDDHVGEVKVQKTPKLKMAMPTGFRRLATQPHLSITEPKKTGDDGSRVQKTTKKLQIGLPTDIRRMPDPPQIREARAALEKEKAENEILSSNRPATPPNKDTGPVRTPPAIPSSKSEYFQAGNRIPPSSQKWRVSTIPLPPDVMENLRVSIMGFPETMLLTTCLTIETIRVYSKKMKNNSRPRHSHTPDGDGGSMFSLDESVADQAASGIQETKSQRRWLKRVLPWRTHKETAPRTSTSSKPPLWTCIKSIFSSAPDYMCDALYAHLVAYNYIDELLTSIPTLFPTSLTAPLPAPPPAIPRPFPTLRTSKSLYFLSGRAHGDKAQNQDGETGGRSSAKSEKGRDARRVPKKAASILGLGEAARAEEQQRSNLAGSATMAHFGPGVSVKARKQYQRNIGNVTFPPRSGGAGGSLSPQRVADVALAPSTPQQQAHSQEATIHSLHAGLSRCVAHLIALMKKAKNDDGGRRGGALPDIDENGEEAELCARALAGLAEAGLDDVKDGDDVSVAIAVADTDFLLTRALAELVRLREDTL